MKPQSNLLTSFKPVYYAQIFNCAAKANFYGNKVKRLTIYQKIYSIIYLSLCTYSYYYVTSNKHFDEFTRPKTVKSLLTTTQMFSGLMLNVNIIVINNFFYNDINVELYETLLHADRMLKIHGKKERIFEYKFVLLSTIFVFVFHSTYVINNIVNAEILQDYIWISIGGHFLVTEYLELVLMLAILFVMINRIQYINKIIHLSNLVKWRDEVIDHSEMMYRMWRAYEEIASVYRIVEKTFSVFMLLLVVHTFFFLLLTVELLTRSNELYSSLGQNFIGSILIARVTLIGVTLNRLEVHLKRSEEVCICVIHKSNNVSTRRYAKNIIRVIDINMKPMTVLGMFTISTVPLKLISITTTYAIVLLQFAYL